MCPACMTTILITAASATSAGGLIAWVTRKLQLIKRVFPH